MLFRFLKKYNNFLKISRFKVKEGKSLNEDLNLSYDWFQKKFLYKKILP